MGLLGPKSDVSGYGSGTCHEGWLCVEGAYASSTYVVEGMQVSTQVGQSLMSMGAASIEMETVTTSETDTLNGQQFEQPTVSTTYIWLLDSANNDSWAWTFTKSFFTFAGGPGNKPTCAGQTLRSIGNELTGGFFTSQAAETSLKAASIYQTAAALQYAASKPNSLGGIGLICPSCSSVFRSMMSKAKFLGEASEALPLIETSYAAGSSIPEVSAQARSGECAAALPIF